VSSSTLNLQRGERGGENGFRPCECGPLEAAERGIRRTLPGITRTV
jgi:hypothetical protein